MASQWFALRSKPRKEDAVWRQIHSQGFETFYPRLRVQPVNPRSRKLIPYFPGYLFVRADLDEIGQSTFQWMPHTMGLVSFGGEPAVVPDNLVHAIQKRVEEINAAGGEVFDGLEQGQTVKISAGPFQGFEAIFDVRLPGTERVRVLLELLGSRRQVPVVLSAGQIERKKKK
ncbi:MAG: transcription termination/antitermination NusG family protein [Chloroflexota bacterium]